MIPIIEHLDELKVVSSIFPQWYEERYGNIELFERLHNAMQLGVVMHFIQTYGLAVTGSISCFDVYWFDDGNIPQQELGAKKIGVLEVHGGVTYVHFREDRGGFTPVQNTILAVMAATTYLNQLWTALPILAPTKKEL